MTIPIPQFSFAAGELAPSMFGRLDLAKYKVGCSTMRNMFVSYRGGANSRAGTAFVGQSKQTYASGYAPRLIKFQYNIYQGYALEFGELYMRIIYRGAFVSDLQANITNIEKGFPTVVTAPAHGFSNGDWVEISDVSGMLNVDDVTYIVASATTNTFQITDTNGNQINSLNFLSYTGGGIASRIYTVASPYHAADLAYLKFTQSADVMSLTCVNPQTKFEYPPYDLSRISNTNWTFTQTNFGTVVSPPASCTATATVTTGSDPTSYAYVATAIDSSGNESIASPIANVTDSVDISAEAGSVQINWATVAAAQTYNIYKAPTAYNNGGPVPIGVLFGFLGTSYGTSFNDSNITADFDQVPPKATDPFALAAIQGLTITAGGSGYSTAAATITSATGSGFSANGVCSGGAVVAWVVVTPGSGYQDTDTVVITGDGSGATATPVIGPSSGTYPSVVAYFQQRRVYASTLNEPDTYFMSQPGAYTNFDARIPPIDSDAITGTPWAQQVNGVQFMVPMPGGLVVLTGLGAWQVTGSGGSSINPVAITPSNQQATPQAYNGCNDHVPPIPINYDILYVQAKGSIVRDLSYNFFVNIYTGTDLTVLSSHLFTGYQIIEWGWAEEPYKIVWAVRDDGTLLSLTYLKEQEVYAWARHDTNGFYVSTCTVTEPPVDAPYFVVQRYVGGQWVYYIERMDNRIWGTVEDTWCVDCGLSLPQNAPQATLTASSATGSQNITEYIVISGGSGYTAPQGEVIDLGGTGSGATIGSFTIADGVITAVVPGAIGAGYTGPCQLLVTDSTGAGAVIQPVITNIVEFSASASVFSNVAGSGTVGDVIRMGGGRAVVTSFVNSTTLLANIVQPIAATIPNDPNNGVVPQTNGTVLTTPQTEWTISTPVTEIYGLDHLNGLQVSILADGAVVPNQVVENGMITLQNAASQVLIGLGFVAQLQNLFLEAPGAPSVQGKRKNIYDINVRVEQSRGIQIGTNQIDASTQIPGTVPIWDESTGMTEVAERNNNILAGNEIPLFTGDVFQHCYSEFRTEGQVALQQVYPLPMNVLLTVADYIPADEPGA